jgi:catechol 2,3-dioxygenase-like lactoylglutathione lyase family enzyme
VDIAALVPELDVTDLDVSLQFYLQVLGFSVLWSRPEERFAYLMRERAQLMLQAAAGPGRRFRNAVLEPPFGRGINFQIAVSDVDALHADVQRAGYALTLPLEERWYRVGATSVGQRQFVVADPDGYLLRFYSHC